MDSRVEVLRVHPNLEGASTMGGRKGKKAAAGHQTMATEFYATEAAGGSTGGGVGTAVTDGGGSGNDLVAARAGGAASDLQMTDGDFLSMVYNR